MKNFKGFTLIELLIVIALLGALAVGLLAALDPFEQLKKGTDTGVRNTVSEVHGAIIRYYGIKNYMPWCSNGATCTTTLDGVADTFVSPVVLSSLPQTIQAIVDAGELKSDFTQLAGGAADKIYVNGSNSGATVSVCFKPTAKSFIKDPNTKFTQAGVGTCAAADPTQLTCYWCVK